MGRLSRYDLIQLGIGMILAVSVFLPWYATDAAANPNSNIDGKTGDLSAWEVHPVLRWILIAAAIGALFSAWQTLRAQKTATPRGEMAGTVAVLITSLILFAGLVTRPGDGSIHLEYGWFIALTCGVAEVGIALRRMPVKRRTPRGA